MPVFLDDFARLVNGKRYYLKDKILRGKPSLLESDLRESMFAHWVFLGDLSEFSASPRDLDVIAVDSSVYTNLLSNGGVFYIIRAMSMRRDIVNRKIDSDVIFGRDKMSRIHELISVKMEMLEFEVILKALQDGFDGDVIMLDGSLYGRASHLPMEFKVEEERDALLHYFRIYKELLDFCCKSGVLLVGVSKESRSTFYRDYLLSLIFDRRMEELDIEEEDKRLLRDVFFQVLDIERVAFKRFYELKEKYGSKLNVIELILRELASYRPDYQLIINYISSIGYMRPLLLGPNIRMGRRLKECSESPKKYVGKYFPRLTIDGGDEFVEWASRILRGILEFPSFVSFYVLLDPRDSPIRIDMPYYNKGLLEVSWPEPVEVDVRNILKVMVTGYCGLNAYNIWLKSVDERVRLRREIVDDIYFPYLERIFGEKIIRGRGYRRVKYP
ncbi:MAG: DNA double-strand break repair nuclease NurA [Candidatus Bathyarchaeia archaeon]